MDEWLKKLLGEDLYKTFTEKLGDEKKKLLYQKNEGDFVPRSRIDEEKAKLEPLQTKVTELEGQLKIANEKVTKLEDEKKSGTQTTDDKIKELTDKIEKLTNDGLEKDKKLVNDKKESALTLALIDAEADKSSIPYLISQFRKDGNLDHVELDATGIVTNFEELHKPIQESNARHYGDLKIEGSVPGGGDGRDVNFGKQDSEDMKRFKELNTKENLSPKELQEMDQLAVKIKTERDKPKEN